MKSHKWKNKYSIPGGHIELGESIEESLKREIKEETGLKIYNIRFMGFQDFIFDKAFYEKKHFIFLDFACKTNSKKVKLDSEAQSFIWTTIKKALKLPIEPYTRNMIKEFNKRFPNGI